MKSFFAIVWVFLYFRVKGTCLDIAETLQDISHDSLTRFLKSDGSGQKRLEQIFAGLDLSGGYLILDDTVCEKPHAKELAGIGPVYSTKAGKVVIGYCTVILIWVKGSLRIPISLRLWQPEGKSKIDIALEMLSYARNVLKIKPEYVLFDSWYAAAIILKRIIAYGWHCCTCLKSNRKLNGVPLEKLAWRNHWRLTGTLEGGIKVFVVKNGNRFFATTKVTATRKELLGNYSKRTTIEEVIRVLKQECCFSSCQVSSVKAQENHRWCSLYAFAVLSIESNSRNMTIYKLRKNLCRRDSTLSLDYFERLREAA